MGFTFSKNVNFETPAHDVAVDSKYQFHSHDLNNKTHLHQPNCQMVKPSASKASNCAAPNKNAKPSRRHKRPPPTVEQIQLAPSVLVVGDENSDVTLVGYSPVYKKPGAHPLDNVLGDFNKEFEGLVEDLENHPDNDDDSRDKLRKFVQAWKHGLSFPHARIEKVCSDIPLAATSFCKQGISRWQRCHRYCLVCTSANTSEHLLEDLLHKESLERFMYETEFAHVASSIVIRQNLKRMQLFESVKHPDDERKPEEEEEEDEEDLTIEMRFNVPPPIHLEHSEPDKLIHLPSPDVMHHKAEQHHQKLFDTLEKEEGIPSQSSLVNPEHHHHLHLDRMVDKMMHPGQHHDEHIEHQHSHQELDAARSIVSAKSKKHWHVGFGHMISKIIHHDHHNEEHHEHEHNKEGSHSHHHKPTTHHLQAESHPPHDQGHHKVDPNHHHQAKSNPPQHDQGHHNVDPKHHHHHHHTHDHHQAEPRPQPNKNGTHHDHKKDDKHKDQKKDDKHKDLKKDDKHQNQKKDDKHQTQKKDDKPHKDHK